jgi:hypothetical protein
MTDVHLLCMRQTPRRVARVAGFAARVS